MTPPTPTPRFDPKDIRPAPLFFRDANAGEMAYVYPDSEHWTAGWLLRKTRGGEWITYRKATDADIVALNTMVVKGHHHD
jgi:hypothetical protein